MSDLQLKNCFFKLPIYRKIKITEENWNSFLAILNLGRADKESLIEGYNPFRRTNSKFGGWSNIHESLEYFTQYDGTDRIAIKCRRYGDVLDFFIHYDPEQHVFFKVGQYPSVADFHIYELRRYSKVLSAEKLKEFSKGIGLSATGVGIGAFVYLRRIFESLIWTKFEEHKQDLNINVSEFAVFRMDDKIQTLKNFLPTF